MNNNLCLTTVPDLLGRKFFIPDYQRGFRWDSHQVIRLLDDLESFFLSQDTSSQFYCLQTLVVKQYSKEQAHQHQLEGEWYEVIDGQQRLTTIRLIAAILDAMEGTPSIHAYDLYYATRPELREVFGAIEVAFNPESKLREIRLSKEIAPSLDATYILNAAERIVDWFNGGEAADINARKNLFGTYFFGGADKQKSVQFIWYDCRDEKDPRTLFSEINDLTVPLSTSELIRSLFFSRATPYRCRIPLDSVKDEFARQELERTDRQRLMEAINTKWNEIELQLSDERMQAFIDDGSGERPRGKIEMLFDLVAGKKVAGGSEKQDPLYTFLYFYGLLLSGQTDTLTLWKRIERAYAHLREWMNDRDYYHWIGYLNMVSAHGSVLSELLELAETKNKLEFREEIEKRIRESLRLPVASLDELDYQNPRQKDYIKRLLTFYNIEKARANLAEPFFPFEQFKYAVRDGRKVPRRWTLEHIHAQNSECLPANKEVWKEWLRLNLNMLKKMPNVGPLPIVIERLQKASDNNLEGYTLESADATKPQMKVLFNMVTSYYDAVAKKQGQPVPVHSLSNLTLLSGEVNASIGCSPFIVKHDEILRMAREGQYFPQATLEVFAKAFGGSLSLYEWSATERQAYFDDIINHVKNYL